MSDTRKLSRPAAVAISAERELSEPSTITSVVVSILYPFMLMLGFYIIINGHYTPGGGFQGGATLASVFIARYVVFPVEDIRDGTVHAWERLFLALIVLGPILLLFTGFVNENPEYQIAYLTLMDILIGLQVGLGLSVVVFRFAFFRGVGKSWR